MSPKLVQKKAAAPSRTTQKKPAMTGGTHEVLMYSGPIPPAKPLEAFYTECEKTTLEAAYHNATVSLRTTREKERATLKEYRRLVTKRKRLKRVKELAREAKWEAYGRARKAQIKYDGARARASSWDRP